MKADDKDNKLDRLIRSAIGRDPMHFDFQKWQRDHQQQVNDFKAVGATGTDVGASACGLVRRIIAARLSKLAVAAAVVLLAAVSFVELGGSLDGANVAWAQVSRRFQAVPFFSVTLYVKDDATSEPTQIELWMSQDWRIRLRLGKQVVFGRDGVVIKAFDIPSRQAVKPDRRAETLVEKIGQAGDFSLEAIVQVMFGGQAQEVTPRVNPNAAISQDVVVFDVNSPDSPQWARIWALRTSRLPVRIRTWDPTDGAMADGVFEYSKGQPAEFFDPNAFGTLLRSNSASRAGNIAYALLQDPGGKNIRIEERLKEPGYHAPVVVHGPRAESRAESNPAAEQRRVELAAYYQTHPLPERAELVARGDDRCIYLTGKENYVPAHPDYIILPINYSISGVISNLRALGAETSDAGRVHPYAAAIRFVEGLQDRELRADLVHKDDIALAECFHLVFAACGMELTTQPLPAQPVLVARYDGRTLANSREVYAPWHEGETRMGGRAWRVADLLECLSQQMPAGVFILDQTGLEEPVCIGNGNPPWQGTAGIAQARRWLQDQFGITLAQETRTVPTYVVQRKR